MWKTQENHQTTGKQIKKISCSMKCLFHIHFQMGISRIEMNFEDCDILLCLFIYNGLLFVEHEQCNHINVSSNFPYSCDVLNEILSTCDMSTV